MEGTVGSRREANEGEGARAAGAQEEEYAPGLKDPIGERSDKSNSKKCFFFFFFFPRARNLILDIRSW